MQSLVTVVHNTVLRTWKLLWKQNFNVLTVTTATWQWCEGKSVLTNFIVINACCLITQLCPTLWGSMDYSRPGSFVHGILQARVPEWVAFFFLRGSSQPRDQTASLVSPALAGRFFTTSATWEALKLWYTYNICMYQIITLYTLNLHNIICQLYLNKTGRKNNKKSKLKKSKGRDRKHEKR